MEIELNMEVFFTNSLSLIHKLAVAVVKFVVSS
jgi:hypothetical protein